MLPTIEWKNEAVVMIDQRKLPVSEVYVTCRTAADVAKAIRQAEGLGATVMKESTEVPGMGWFGVLVDPTGAAFAVWQIREG